MELYRPEPSHLPSKKYKVLVMRDGRPRLIHFGSRSHSHFRDKLGHYSALDHNDERRRELYYKRFGHATDKNTAKFTTINFTKVFGSDRVWDETPRYISCISCG